MYDLVIIGGGPAGLAAAVAAREEGIDNLIILEREGYLGGTLKQSIHNGYGLERFKEDLTGPEYAQKFVDKIKEICIDYKLQTTVLELNNKKEIIAVNGEKGILKLDAKAVILAVGCREVPRTTLNLSGGQNAGIFTAGSAQKFINLDGYMPGKEVVIFGSGDMGLIMARRLVLEGAKVKAVVEPLSYCTGSRKNVVQCIRDFHIPLMLEHTISTVHGKDRVEGVTISPLNSESNLLGQGEEFVRCDTILLAADFIPENELPRQCGIKLSPITGGAEVDENMHTSIEGIFACGNAVHYHDTVDDITLESYKAGKKAADYVRGFIDISDKIKITNGPGVHYVVPSVLNKGNTDNSIELSFRVDAVYEDSNACLYIDGQREVCIHKRIMTPGDLENIIITPNVLERYQASTEVTLLIERD